MCIHINQKIESEINRQMQKTFIQDLIYQYYSFLVLAHNTNNFTKQAPIEKVFPLALVGSAQLVEKIQHCGKPLYAPVLNWNGLKLVIAIEASEYQKKFGQVFSTIFRRENCVMFTQLRPGFISMSTGTQFAFFVTSLSSLLSVSQTLYESLLNPMSNCLHTQQYSQINLHQDTALVEYLRSKSSKVKFLSGIVEIVKKKSIKVYDIARNQYTLNVYSRTIGAKQLGVYKLHIDYNPKEDEDPVQDHGHYLFLNTSLKITDWGELVHTLQFTSKDFKKGLSPVYLLEKDPVLLPPLQKAIALSNVSDIPRTILMRNLIKVRVMFTEFEIMVVKYLCIKCHEELKSAYCGDCGTEGNLMLWSQCIGQDCLDSTPCLLKLERHICTSFYQLTQEVLEKLKNYVIRNGILALHLRQKSKIPELMQLYFYFKFFTIQKTIIATPFIDIYGTERKGMEVQDRIDFQTGFMNKKEYHNKLKVNINGGFYEGTQIFGLDVKEILTQQR